MPALRVTFLVAVVAFAWLGLRGRWDEVGDALAATSPLGVVAGFVLVLLGLSATGVLWLRLMTCLDARLPYVGGSSTFFVGQLGKYIPGSVWSIGAQAEMARRYRVPARATVSAGLLFLGYHVATGVLVATPALLRGRLDSPWPDWVTVVAAGVAVIGLVPAVVQVLGRTIGGRPVRIGWTDTLVFLVLMAVAWAAYGAALVLLSPGTPWADLPELTGAFAAAYAVGVVIVLAPAGLGAREAVFVLLLTPVTGVGPATALALLARVVHTAADATVAACWWALARRAPGAAAPGLAQPSRSSTSS